jgi:Dihaem cytochrome c
MRGKGTIRIWLSIVGFSATACSSPLPEDGTAAAELYRARCGSCHRAVNPASMKLAVWKMVLPRMEQRMKSATEPALSDDERRVLESYLERNSAR